MNVSPTRSELKLFWILISVVVYCLKILGLAPFSLNMKKISCTNSSSKFLFSKTGLAYNIFVLVLVPVMAGFLFPRLLSLKYKHESVVTQATDISQGILCVFTVWIIIANWTFNQGKAARTMNRILEIDGKLSGRDNKRTTDKTSLVLLTTHVILNLFLWVIVVATESVELVISDAFVNWFFFTIPSFVIYCFMVEYLMVVGLVAERLVNINKNLSNFNEFRYYLSRRSFFNEHQTAGWHLSINYSQLEALNLLRNIRTEIFDISQDIAEFFSLPILGCMAYSFFSLVYNVHYIITVAVLENDDISIANTYVTVTWILLSIYPLGWLFFNVTKSVTEAKRTGRLIHKLLSTAVTEEIKAELEIFSLQLLHENIDFTAYGFFTLDFTLLHSMLGATATYLVILLQFQ